jgi:hypothetical protein
MSNISTSVKSLEFGELYINSSVPSSKSFSISNLSERGIKINLNVSVTLSSFPADIMVILDDNDTPILNTLLGDSFVSSSIYLRPFVTQGVNLSLIPKSYPSLLELGDLANRTTFSKSIASLTFESDTIELDERNVITIPLIASFCLSLMSIDDDKIDFDQSVVGNTFVRDFQIWNRSECPLIYRLVPQNNQSNVISFQDFDNSTPIPLRKSFEIAAYGSKRIRTAFRAKDVGEDEYTISIENVNNTLNKLSLFIRTSVIEKVKVI